MPKFTGTVNVDYSCVVCGWMEPDVLNFEVHCVDRSQLADALEQKYESRGQNWHDQAGTGCEDSPLVYTHFYWDTLRITKEE